MTSKEDKDLTWDKLADDYDACHSGRPARTLLMQYVFAWAEEQTEKYELTKTGTLRYVNGGEK